MSAKLLRHERDLIIYLRGFYSGSGRMPSQLETARDLGVSEAYVSTHSVGLIAKGRLEIGTNGFRFVDRKPQLFEIESPEYQARYNCRVFEFR